MFNRFALVFAGLMLTVSSVGCCCLGGYGYGTGYGARSCPPCNNGCAPAGGGYYPQQGAFLPGMDTSQTAYSTSGFSQTAFAPVQSSMAPTTAAFVPTQSAALIPGAVQGPPIYNNAFAPTNSLPLY